VSIQITQSERSDHARSVEVSTPSGTALESLRSELERNHCVRLPGLLDRGLLDRVRREIEAGEFARRDVELKTELLMKPGRAFALLAFLVNDPDLFEVVRRISGCERIRSFTGRVYRMLPDSDHRGAWHDDLVEGRAVAMNLNLGREAYSGGVLEIRDRDSRTILHRVANTGPGDAVIFRISPLLQHRVTPVEGTVPKTAYVGFFEKGSDRPRPEAMLAGESAPWER